MVAAVASPDSRSRRGTEWLPTSGASSAAARVAAAISASARRGAAEGEGSLLHGAASHSSSQTRRSRPSPWARKGAP